LPLNHPQMTELSH